MTNKTLLVTGAAGFTGHHLIHQASARGFKCIALVQSELSRQFPCESIVIDLLNFDGLKEVLSRYQFDYVVHLAAIAFVGHGSVDDIYRTNIVGTTNLLDALIDTQESIAKVLIASSGNVYGNNTQLPLTETSIVEPVNDYAVSKFAMEMAISIRKSKLPIVITRPFNYTGIGQHPNFLIPKIVSAFKHKQTRLQLGNLDVARDFTDVRDLVTAYCLLLENPQGLGTFNVCSGRATSLQSVIEMCEQYADYKIEIIVNSDFVRENEIRTLYGSEHQLRLVLGEYRQYTLQETIQWMLEEYSQ
jgi:nucleoside-diphosphate-sugar epimerase